LLGFEIKGDKNFTLGDLVNEGVTAHADQITVIATNATQESVLEEMMAKVCSRRPVGGLWSKFGPLEDVGVPRGTGEACRLRTPGRTDSCPRRSPRPGRPRSSSSCPTRM
jgi:hypothetical protein